MKDPTYRAYIHQRNTALRRAIGWRFTFHLWVYWWEQQLGPDWFKKRGRKLGQYVMARRNDEGPYALDNVLCQTNTENTLSIKFWNKPNTLTEQQVKEILAATGSVREIGRRLHVCYNTVSRVRRGAAYKWIDR